VGMEVDWVLASPCLYAIVCSCYLLVVLYLSTLMRDGTLLSIWRPGLFGVKGQKGPVSFFIPAKGSYIWCTMRTVPNPQPPVLSREQIDWLTSCTSGKLSHDSSTGLVSVKGNFNCSLQGLEDLKGVRFGTVTGYFNADGNLFTTLDGFPREILGHLYLTSNLLTSLKNGPREVGGHLTLHDNQLTSLEGLPRKIGGELWVSSNPVSEEVLRKIAHLMGGLLYQNYLDSVELLWSEIPIEDQALLYRPNFYWIGPEEKRKIEAFLFYSNIKNML
jgi:hypothetical protein